MQVFNLEYINVFIIVNPMFVVTTQFGRLNMTKMFIFMGWLNTLRIYLVLSFK